MSMKCCPWPLALALALAPAIAIPNTCATVRMLEAKRSISEPWIERDFA